jgi:small subunit ribosomal protein S17
MDKTLPTTTESQKGKVLKGTVVSAKMKDTVVVRIERFEKHPRYGKYIRIRKNIKAHDAGNTKAEGDIVLIKETRPISKDKKFVVITE